jgi:hypothetical protein
MADVSEAVRLFMLSKPAITDLIGSRIYADIVPQNAPLPSVAMSKVSTRHDHTLSNFAGMAHCRVQFDCYASTRAVANEVAELLRVSGLVATKGVTFGCNIRGARVESGQRNEIDYSDESSDDHRYVTSFDFEIDYKEEV